MADQPDPIQQKIDEAAHAVVGTLPTPVPETNPQPPATPTPANIVPPSEEKLPPPPEPPPHPVKPKSHPSKIAAVVAGLILLVSLPVAIYFVSQKQEPVADVRSKAAGSGQCTGGCYLPVRLECYPDQNNEASCNQKGCDWGFTTCGTDNRPCGPCTSERCWGSCDGKSESDCKNTSGCRWETMQQSSTCDPTQSWPRGPTPNDGAINISLSPTFRWDQDVRGPGGYYANVYLWTCAAHNDTCLIGFGHRESETGRITEIPINELRGYSSPGKIDYNKSVSLSPNTKYWWYVTPGVCRIVHFEEGKTWTFTTAAAPTPTPTPPAQCQRIKVYKGGSVVADLTTLRTGDQLELAVVGANATKAHIRVNGAAYVETTTKNAAGEYTIAYTIPAGTYSFTLEAEVYQNGTWQ